METWHITLEEDGTTIRAYEDNYRDFVDIYAVNLLSWITNEEGKLTVRGKLKKNGIELNQLVYQDYTLDTNLKSQRYRRYEATTPAYISNPQGYRYGRQ